MNRNTVGPGPWHCVDITAHIAEHEGDVAQGIQAAVRELNEEAPNVDQVLYLSEFHQILVHRRS